MSSSRVPIILCGRSESVGSLVIHRLRPEYEVVHFITTNEDGINNIPRLLTGEEPIDRASSIGSGDYSSMPVAIIIGGGYEDSHVKMFRDALKPTPSARKIPWLRADVEKTKSERTKPDRPPFPDQVANRAKALLDQLRAQGKLDGNDDGDYYW